MKKIIDSCKSDMQLIIIYHVRIL